MVEYVTDIVAALVLILAGCHYANSLLFWIGLSFLGINITGLHQAYAVILNHILRRKP